MSSNDRNHLKIFGGSSTRELTAGICAHLDLPVGLGTVTRFPDGETMVKVDEDVRGRDVYVVLSTCEPVNDNLMELLVFIDCLRRASAKRITAVIPSPSGVSMNVPYVPTPCTTPLGPMTMRTRDGALQFTPVCSPAFAALQSAACNSQSSHSSHATAADPRTLRTFN